MPFLRQKRTSNEKNTSSGVYMKYIMTNLKIPSVGWNFSIMPRYVARGVILFNKCLQLLLFPCILIHIGILVMNFVVQL